MKTVLKNGKIVLPDRVLENGAVVIEGADIRKICTEEEFTDDCRVIDLKGKYVLPGMIDIHSDMIESLIQPRSTAVMDFEMGLREAERVLCSCGITTMYHSISMYREGTWDVKEIRQAPQVKKLAELIGSYRHRNRLIRHRFHLRYEIDNVACYEDVMDMIGKGLVDLLSFMDHTPGQGQYKNLEVYRKHQPNSGRDLSEEEFRKLLEREKTKETVSFQKLKEMADYAAACKIATASHDDDTIEKLKVNKELGVRISEFPITEEVAKEAVRQGYMTVVGAPNILLGGSHSGNLSALTAIRENAADVLVSDYYPQALLYAVFYLFRKERIPLNKAASFVTLNPAKAVGIDHMTGSVEEGKQADLLVVSEKEGLPVLEQVYVSGTEVFRCQYREADV